MGRRPDGGYGKDQPGGWTYNILAYMEQEAMRNLGRGVANRFVDPLNAERQSAFRQLLSTPLPIFNCPTKRPNELWPYAEDPLNPYLAMNAFSCSYSNGCRVARSDYRVNSGNKSAGDQPGPAIITRSRNVFLANRSAGALKMDLLSAEHGSRIANHGRHIEDMLLGEKYFNPDRYFDGKDSADDQCVFTGHDRDNAGYTSNDSEPMPPLRDRPRVSLSFYFGSPHASGLNMVFCDGSAHHISYDVAEKVWRRYGGRDDEAG